MIDIWAITLEAYKAFQIEYDRLIKAGSLSEKNLSRFSRRGGDRGENDNPYRLRDKAAVIPISGVLRKRDNFFSWLTGSSTYSAIQKALRAAAGDPDAEKITLLIDSPGGQLEGVFDTMNLIKEIDKPIEAVIDGMAASAAYGLASQADQIISTNDSNNTGSIGVVYVGLINDEIVEISSSDAPKKRPDLSTDKGKKIIIEQLDDIHEKFVDLIAEGRSAASDKKITPKKVNRDFGRGGILLADKALEGGMIDSINPAPHRSVNVDFFRNQAESSGGASKDDFSSTELTVLPVIQNAKLIDEPFSKEQSERRWRDHTGATEKPNARFKKRFAWYNSDESDLFGSYKLPHWDYKEATGEFVNIAAVRNGLARLEQTTGIPAPDKTRIRANLRRYLDRFNEQKTGASSMTPTELKTQFPETYQEIFNAGIRAEKDRIQALLKMGASSGKLDYAIECIDKDKSIDEQTVRAEFLSAEVNKKETDKRKKDDPPPVDPGEGKDDYQKLLDDAKKRLADGE